jgi:ABC-type antimicrobial peptide transport system permease subunit
VRFLHGARLAVRSLRRSRVRSILMMLGIIVGIASLTTLQSVGESTRRATLQRFKAMVGTFDTIIVRPGAGKTRGMPSLTSVDPSLKFPDAEELASNVGEVSRVALVQNAFDIDVRYGDRTVEPAVFGISPNWSAIRDDEAMAGDLLSDADEEGLARVTVLGMDVVTALFNGDPQSALGRTVRIADVPFEVRGVLRPRGAGPAGGSLDNLVLIPVSTASRRLFNRDFLTMAIAQLKDPAQSEAALDHIRVLLRERHHLATQAPDDFTLISPRASFARVTAVGSLLGQILAGVAALATILGGAVIMNLMLVGVSERRREIGVRRSLGASRHDILVQFLLEAILVAAGGGALGAILGVGGTRAATAMGNLPTVAPWAALLSAAALSLAVGLAFGVYPAWRAAHVDPVTALRD